MIIKNATREQMQQALEAINADRFAGNIGWRRAPEAIGRRFRFTLRAIDSAGKGGRLGAPHASWTTRTGKAYKQRRIGQAACWHVHGYYFEALLKLAPEAEISAGLLKINAQGGNWKDRNIGSMVEPFYYSEACECA